MILYQWMYMQCTYTIMYNHHVLVHNNIHVRPTEHCTPDITRASLLALSQIQCNAACLRTWTSIQSYSHVHDFGDREGWQIRIFFSSFWHFQTVLIFRPSGHGLSGRYGSDALAMQYVGGTCAHSLAFMPLNLLHVNVGFNITVMYPV